MMRDELIKSWKIVCWFFNYERSDNNFFWRGLWTLKDVMWGKGRRCYHPSGQYLDVCITHIFKGIYNKMFTEWKVDFMIYDFFSLKSSNEFYVLVISDKILNISLLSWGFFLLKYFPLIWKMLNYNNFLEVEEIKK